MARLSVSFVSASCSHWQKAVEGPVATMCRMMITLCDISALARWGEAGLLERLGGPCDPPAGGAWSLPSASGLSELDLRGSRIEATAERPLHVLVSSAGGRIRSKRLRCHVWSTDLPEGALYQLSDEILIASPRFCLQQMAARSSLACTAAVGMEVCGRYARSPRAPGGGFPQEAAADDARRARRAFCDQSRVRCPSRARGPSVRRRRLALAHGDGRGPSLYASR